MRDAIEACYPHLAYRRATHGETACSAGAFDRQSPELLRARAAVSRAVRRLEERKLVVRLMARHSRWSGLALTDEGRRAGKLEALWANADIATPSTARRLQRRTAARQEEEEALALIEAFHRQQDQQARPAPLPVVLTPDPLPAPSDDHKMAGALNFPHADGADPHQQEHPLGALDHPAAVLADHAQRPDRTGERRTRLTATQAQQLDQLLQQAIETGLTTRDDLVQLAADAVALGLPEQGLATIRTRLRRLRVKLSSID